MGGLKPILFGITEKSIHFVEDHILNKKRSKPLTTCPFKSTELIGYVKDDIPYMLILC